MEIFGKKIDGAFIIIAVLIIAGVTWGIVSMVMGMLSKGTAMIASQAGVLDSYQYAAYDNKYVTGDTVIAAIKMAQSPSPNRLKVTVITTGGTTTPYAYTDPTNPSSTYTAYTETNPTASAFINPTGTFKAELIKTNGVLTEIKFTLQ